MSNSLLFKIKADVDVDKYRLLELFFRDWVDNTCENEVHYKIESVPGSAEYSASRASKASRIARYGYETFRVDFEKQEDALALKLKGVPEEFRHYLEILG